MNKVTSIAIRREFPELADRIMAAADSDPGLMQALQDFRHADERASDDRSPTEDRALWSEIRNELAIEISRVYVALTENATRDKRQ